jgi:hypothetical protein
MAPQKSRGHIQNFLVGLDNHPSHRTELAETSLDGSRPQRLGRHQAISKDQRGPCNVAILPRPATIRSDEFHP